MTTATAPTEAKPATPAEQVAAETAALDQQIQAAVESASKTDAVAKGKTTKVAKKAEKAVAEKREPAKAAPAEEPAEVSSEETIEETSEESQNEPEEKSFKPLSKQRLQAMLDSGDLDGAFEAAFGKKPSDFNINSKRWAEWRQVNQAKKRQLNDYHQQLQGAAQQLRQDFAPFIQAKQLAEKGDLAGAIQSAFGLDVSEFNKKLIRSLHGEASSDPKVEKLEKELAAMRAERQQELERQQQAQREQQLAQQREAYKKTIASEIAESGDAQLARFAKKPNFVEHVLTILRQNYDRETDTSIPIVEAADMARQAILDEFGDVFGEPRDADDSAESVRGGSIPAKAVVKTTKTLSQRGAAEASAPSKNGKPMSADELADYFADQHRAAIGKAPIRPRA
jgi:hypothetical protein